MTKPMLIATMLSFIAAVPSSGQVKRGRVVRPKMIRAKAAAKPAPVVPAAAMLPNESDTGIWNTFASQEDGFEMLFPTTHRRILDDSIGRVRSLQAVTGKANYILAIRDLGKPVSNEGMDTFLEEVIKNSFASPGTRLIDHRNISYGGSLGKQVIIEKDAKRTSTRLYVLDGKLFVMSVTLATKDYDRTFEKWITKFFDSFIVRVPVFNEA